MTHTRVQVQRADEPSSGIRVNMACRLPILRRTFLRVRLERVRDGELTVDRAVLMIMLNEPGRARRPHAREQQ